MTDAEILQHVEWAGRPTRGLKGVRLQMSANIDPINPGDLPIGEAVEFKATNRTAYVWAAYRTLTRRVVKRYREFNEN
tara:strand:+ start:1091 stop:1324 length:234 start_codon:yes stop_codon:yes gene_type:complete